MPIEHPENNHHGLKFYRIASILLLMFSVNTALKLFGFRHVYRFLARAEHRPEKENHRTRPLTEAKKTAAMLQQVNRDYSLFGNPCLAESLALWWLLIRRGIEARFRIGVRTLTGVFESHAWVEFDGHVLNDVEHAEKIFTVFDLSSLTET